MTPEEAMQNGLEMIVSEGYAPKVMEIFRAAADVPTAAATIVAPMVFDLIQRGEIPDEELFGTEDGDGIAIRWLSELFGIAADGGLADVDDPAEQRAMAEKAVQVLGDMLAPMIEKIRGGQPQMSPTSNPQEEMMEGQVPGMPEEMPEQPRRRGLLSAA